MEKLQPGIGDRFRMPRGSDQNVLDRARAFLVEAAPMAAEFTARGLPADFLTTLEAAAVEVESRIHAQNAALVAQTASTSAVDAAQKRLTDALLEFNPIVLNTFRADAPVLAAWKSASHVERAPKKAKKQPPTPPTP